jgi:hypothetical protein
MKLNFISISIITLAFSVFASALIISNSLSELGISGSKQATTENKEEEIIMKKQLLSKEEIAEYLGISTKQFDEIDRRQIVSFGDGIPFMESLDGTKYYTIQAIEEWLSDTKNYLSNELSGEKNYCLILSIAVIGV